MKNLINIFWLLLFFSCNKTFERSNPLDGKVLPIISGSQISSITNTSAKATSTITNNGGTTITNKGVVWSTSNSPSINLNTRTNDGTGAVGSFNSDISGLLPATTYYLRGYATNIVGTNYGPEIIFKTTGSIPILTTTAISDTTSTTAISGGNITNDGGALITARGIIWSTSPSPTVSLNTRSIEVGGVGIFNSLITGLTANTKYYVRSYATNSVGTAYGNELNFVTNTINLTNGLIAYYPFSGNANDSSGNVYNGIVNGASLTTDRYGKVNSAYSFNSTLSNYITLPLMTKLSGLSKASFSFWLKTNVVNNSGTIFGHWSNNNGGVGVNCGLSLELATNNKILIANYSGTGGIFTPSIVSATWNHVVILIDFTQATNTTKVNVYLNNILQSLTFQQFNNLIGTATSTYIGRRNTDFNTYGNYYNGLLDDIRIYNRVIDQNEIKYLFTH